MCHKLAGTKNTKNLKIAIKTFLNAEGDHGIATTASTEGSINRSTYEFSMAHAHDNDIPTHVYKIFLPSPTNFIVLKLILALIIII